MLGVRVTVSVLGPVALLLTGFAGTRSGGHAAQPAVSTTPTPRAAQLSRPPTPADFVNDPSCMLFAVGADTRIRVRAARAAPVCTALSKQLSRSGSRWSLHARRARRILSPICHFADPRAQVELEVIDAAADSTRGERICANLARAGWFDLSTP